MSRDDLIKQLKELQQIYYTGRVVWDVADGAQHTVKYVYVTGANEELVMVFDGSCGVSTVARDPQELSIERPMLDGNYLNVVDNEVFVYAKKDLQWYRFHPGNPTFYTSSAPKTGKLFCIVDSNCIEKVPQCQE